MAALEFDGSESEEHMLSARHDIKNQLSNIHLSLGQLRYELPNLSADCDFYLETIETAAFRINEIISKGI